MTKRLVDIDDEVLAQARAAVGASTIKETVHRALVQSVAAERRRRFVERVAAGGLPDLADPEVHEAAWR